MKYQVRRYQDAKNNVPYTKWITKLRKKDPGAAAKIDIRIARATGGNFGDHKFERDGVWELRLNVGPGFRVYYSVKEGEIILLLIGGDKSSQEEDLNKAVDYLKDYEKRTPK